MPLRHRLKRDCCRVSPNHVLQSEGIWSPAHYGTVAGGVINPNFGSGFRAATIVVRAPSQSPVRKQFVGRRR